MERANPQLDDKTGEYYLQPSEATFNVQHLENIDRSRTYTNNIIEIYDYLGIEAARQAIVNELQMTLDGARLEADVRLVDGIDVMTSEGEVRAIGRHGVSEPSTVFPLVRRLRSGEPPAQGWYHR